MNLKPGFRRLFVVLSVALLAAGIALDAERLWSHAKTTTIVTGPDGKEYEITHPEGASDAEILAYAQQYSEGASDAEIIAHAQQNPERYAQLSAEQLARLQKGQRWRVMRGRLAWSWKVVRFTPISGGIVALLWAGLFVVGWVARGFTSQPTP
jgi:hypothetical protein